MGPLQGWIKWATVSVIGLQWDLELPGNQENNKDGTWSLGWVTYCFITNHLKMQWFKIDAVDSFPYSYQGELSSSAHSGGGCSEMSNQLACWLWTPWGRSSTWLLIYSYPLTHEPGLIYQGRCLGGKNRSSAWGWHFNISCVANPTAGPESRVSKQSNFWWKVLPNHVAGSRIGERENLGLEDKEFILRHQGSSSSKPLGRVGAQQMQCLVCVRKTLSLIT